LRQQQQGTITNEVSILGAVVIGILAGWIAERVMGREHGLFTNLIVGFAAFWGSLGISTIGRIVLLALVGTFHRRQIL